MDSKRKTRQRASHTSRTSADRAPFITPEHVDAALKAEKSSRRYFLKMIGSGIAGAVIGGLAVKTYDMLSAAPVSSPPSVVPCEKPTVTPEVKKMIIGYDRNKLQDQLGIFSDAALSLYTSGQKIFCETCDQINQTCSGLELLLDWKTVEGYRSVVSRLSSGQFEEYSAKLTAFDDANAALIKVSEDELELLKKVFANDAQSIAAWNETHKTNEENDNNGYGTRQWQLMNLSQANLAKAILTDGSFSKESLDALQNALQKYRVQDGMLLRNSGFVSVTQQALKTLLKGVEDLYASFEKGTSYLWDMPGVIPFYEGNRHFPTADSHIELNPDNIPKPSAQIWGLCSYLEEELRPKSENIVHLETQEGLYQIPRRLYDRVQLLKQKMGGKASRLDTLMKDATSEQMFRFSHALEYSVDPLTGVDYIDKQAKTLTQEMDFDNVDFDTAIKGANFRRAPLDHGTAADAWDPWLDAIVSGLSIKNQGQETVENEIDKRIREKYSLLRKRGNFCILEKVSEIAELLTGGRTTYTIIFENALARLGGYSDTVFIDLAPSGFASFVRTYENGSPVRLRGYSLQKPNDMEVNLWPDAVPKDYFAMKSYFKSSILAE